MIRFRLALFVAKIIDTIVKRLAPERGSNISGKFAMKIDPNMVAHFVEKGLDPNRVLFITGTNGKSSSNNLLVHCLRDNGLKIISNLEGANLLQGVATALAKAAKWSGKLDYDYAIFETDERFLPLIYAQLPAKHLYITNLQKDQVQRNGDPDFIVRKLESFIHENITMYLNNEEPRSRFLGTHVKKAYYYSVDKNSSSYVQPQDFPGMPCPACFSELHPTYHNVDHVGPFYCQRCGFSSEKDLKDTVKDIDFDKKTFSYHGITYKMPYPLPYMLYNYAGVLSVAEHFAGISPEKLKSSFDNFKNIRGRYESFSYKDKEICYLRIKQENPDTLQNALTIIASDKNEKSVCLGLYTLVDFVPHYCNTFYTYDCDFMPLINSGVSKYLCFSEAAAYDTALRLCYSGVNKNDIDIMDGDEVKELLECIHKLPSQKIYLITWLSTFEALRKEVKQQTGQDISQ